MLALSSKTAWAKSNTVGSLAYYVQPWIVFQRHCTIKLGIYRSATLPWP